MKTKLTYSIALCLLLLPYIAVAGQSSHYSFQSGDVHVTATLSHKGYGHKEEAVLSFRSARSGAPLKLLDSFGFEEPVLFHYHGETFIYVSTLPAGSGGFVTETILWVAPDSTLQEIEFYNAAEAYENQVGEEEMVLSGGSTLDCAHGQLTFEFYIANIGDAHCCPTAGKVTGSYEIVGERSFSPVSKQYSSTFRMLAKHYSRTPISSGEMAVKLRTY